MVFNIRKLNILLSYLMVSLLAIPIFKAPFWGTTYSLIMAAVMGLWLFTAIIYDSKAICSNIIQCQVWLLIFFYILCAVLDIGSIKNVIISITTPWCPMIVFLYYVRRSDYSGLRTIVKWSTITLVITIFTTLYGLISNEYLTRTWGTIGVGSKIQYMYQNIGDMGYVYVAGLMLILLLVLFPQIRKVRSIKFMFLICMGGCLGLVFYGTSGITLITVSVSLICVFVYRIRDKRLRWCLVSCVILAAVILLLSGWFQNFFTWLSYETDNVYLQQKFLSISETLNSRSFYGDVKARTDLYYQNIKIFLESLGIGVGPYYGGSGASTSTIFISEHTQLLADLARYGIIFLIYMMAIHKNFFRILKSIADRCGISYSIEPVMICYIMMYCLQPILQQVIIGYFVFLIWPGMPLLLSKSSLE